MKCLCCESPDPEYRFDVLEVHTLHVRDFDGEKLIQALGEKKRFEVCTACAQSELRAVLFPAKRLLRECLPFVLLLAVGAVLTLTLSFQDVMSALRAIGPLAVFVGISGMIGKVRDVLARRKFLLGREDSERLSAWECLLRTAPTKYNDNDITYIPVDEKTADLNVRALAEKYCLIPAIANQVHSTIINLCDK